MACNNDHLTPSEATRKDVNVIIKCVIKMLRRVLHFPPVKEEPTYACQKNTKTRTKLRLQKSGQKKLTLKQKTLNVIATDLALRIKN